MTKKSIKNRLYHVMKKCGGIVVVLYTTTSMLDAVKSLKCNQDIEYSCFIKIIK